MLIFEWDPGVYGSRLDLYHYDRIGGIQNHNEVLESRVFKGEHGIDGVRIMRGLQWIGIFTRSEEKMRNSEYQSRDPREEHEQGGLESRVFMQEMRRRRKEHARPCSRE